MHQNLKKIWGSLPQILKRLVLTFYSTIVVAAAVKIWLATKSNGGHVHFLVANFVL